LPVIASEGWETGAPITEAGVVLIPETAKNEFGPALLRVLTDAAYRVKLSERSKRAQEVYFSWSAIAARYAKELAHPWGRALTCLSRTIGRRKSIECKKMTPEWGITRFAATTAVLNSGSSVESATAKRLTGVCGSP
jgi:hypothetical protein